MGTTFVNKWQTVFALENRHRERKEVEKIIFICLIKYLEEWAG